MGCGSVSGMKKLIRWITLCVSLVLGAQGALARVLRVEIVSQTDVLGGQMFGGAGVYQRIVGKVYFAVRVDNAHNKGIVDLGNAVNLKGGEVEFAADFVAMRPKDASLGNGTMILENPNRGHSRILSLVDGGDEDLSKSAGDAWLLRNGFTVVALGWQWDAVGDDALKLYAPIAKEKGKTITGLLRGDFMLPTESADMPLGHVMPGSIGGSEYKWADEKDRRNVLTVRDTRDGKRKTIPREEWKFTTRYTFDAVAPRSPVAVIWLKDGFRPGKIYEYVYVVKDPVVAGLSFAAVRDFASYVKHDKDAVAPVARVVGEGISQNGRFLRDFLYEGFNADEDGKMALDGVLSHVAGAGRGSFNYRFAQPSRDAQPTSSVFYPTDIFPFTDQDEADPLTGAKDGLLDRAAKENVLPKIFFSHTSYEYWGRAASLIHTSADGKTDAVIGANVRIYHFTGLQHFSGPWPPKVGDGPLHGQEPQTPLAIKYFWRGMIRNMDAWVRNGTEPPASKYSTIAAQTLVPLGEWKFPKIPGVNVPTEANVGMRLDYGKDWMTTRILTVVPPRVGQAFPVLVPQVDSDGNELGGVHLPEIALPLATYTGWNLRDASIGALGQRVAFEGSFLPFAKNEEERKKNGDPRKSIAERYRSREEYLEKFGKVADELVQQKYILTEDREAIVKRGVEEWDYLVQ